MNMVEIWKEIEGYEGLYEVSNTGKVRSLNYLHTGKVKELKTGKDKDGYLHLILCKDGKKKNYSVHRLVAKAFLDDWSMWFSEINHKDENKTNNNVSNLEWCDRKYNMNYGTHNERVVQTNIKNGYYNQDMCGLDRKEYKRLYMREYYRKKKVS